MAFSAMLDKFAGLERPISLAAVSAPSVPPEPDSLGLNGEYDPGHYRRAWSPEAQAHWMSQMLAVAVGKPFIHSVSWNELYEYAKPSDNRHDGLLDLSGHAKPGLWRLGEIKQAIKSKTSPATLPLMPKAGVL